MGWIDWEFGSIIRLNQLGNLPASVCDVLALPRRSCHLVTLFDDGERLCPCLEGVARMARRGLVNHATALGLDVLHTTFDVWTERKRALVGAPARTRASNADYGFADWGACVPRLCVARFDVDVDTPTPLPQPLRDALALRPAMRSLWCTWTDVHRLISAAQRPPSALRALRVAVVLPGVEDQLNDALRALTSLTTLWLDIDPMQGMTLQHVVWPRTLTRLGLACGYLPVRYDPMQTAFAQQQLPRLTDLSLRGGLDVVLDEYYNRLQRLHLDGVHASCTAGFRPTALVTLCLRFTEDHPLAGISPLWRIVEPHTLNTSRFPALRTLRCERADQEGLCRTALCEPAAASEEGPLHLTSLTLMHCGCRRRNAPESTESEWHGMHSWARALVVALPTLTTLHLHLDANGALRVGAQRHYAAALPPLRMAEEFARAFARFCAAPERGQLTTLTLNVYRRLQSERDEGILEAVVEHLPALHQLTALNLTDTFAHPDTPHAIAGVVALVAACARLRALRTLRLCHALIDRHAAIAPGQFACWRKLTRLQSLAVRRYVYDALVPRMDSVWHPGWISPTLRPTSDKEELLLSEDTIIAEDVNYRSSHRFV